MSLAVFAYASLASPASAEQTLGRPVPAAAPARLHGYRRGWTLARDNHASEKRFVCADGSMPAYCLGLNLDPDPDAKAPNGALIEISEEELERLDLRELRYLRTDVTGAVRARDDEPPAFDAVFAYTARPAHHHPEPPPGSIVIASYPRTIEAAFAALGPGELDTYRATTTPAPVETVDAVLVEDRIPPGNPRAW